MLESNDILRMLPHRVPAVYLDRVTMLSANSAEGYKNVTITEPQFRGHFVNNPVMPGVLTLEAIIQLTWAMYRGAGLDASEPIPADWQAPDIEVELTDVERIRFRSIVRPGDRLDMRVEETAQNGDSRTISGVARVGDKVACEAIIKVDLKPFKH